MRYEYDVMTGKLISLPDLQNLPEKEETIPPQVVSKAQGLLELYDRGLLEQIEVYMTTTATEVEKIAWKNIQQFDYNSPMLNSLLNTFGLTNEDKDSLFISAAKRII